MSENSTSPKRPFESASRSSVAAIRSYVSDEMLAETSRTTIADVPEGANACRAGSSRVAARTRATAASPEVRSTSPGLRVGSIGELPGRAAVGLGT